MQQRISPNVNSTALRRGLKPLAIGTACALGVVAVPASGAVLFQTGTTTISGSTTGLSDSHANATGSFSTAAVGGSAGVSFDLSVTATNGAVGGQSGGLGVTGGSADAGIDNNGGTAPIEALTFTISNVSGLAAGESLVITELGTGFGANGGETYTLDGVNDVAFSSSPETVDVSDSDTVSIGAGSTGDTKFTINSITVEVVPEPGSLALMGLGGLLIARRRRA